MNASVPIEANGIIPVAQSDVANIPPIAFTIPDFEGQAILRIFANSTQSEIGCYSALVTNGVTFSHPAAVGTVLGLFAIVAVVASFATAVYGEHIPTTRTHYAHSLSILVVFSVFHHIFFTGALSMNWPSVLVAFWSNYAWSSGMIYSRSMQDSINQLIGSNKGNTSIVGAAASGSSIENLGGGYSIAAIYKRSYSSLFKPILDKLADKLKILRSRDFEQVLVKRTLANSTTGFSWYGKPVKPGLPLPGNFSGLAGTLAEEDIPASNAFITGFLWLLILIVIVAGLVIGFKWLLEGLSHCKLLKEDRLAYFRKHWVQFTELAVVRTITIAFFMMMFLTLFQFTYKGSAGVTAIAALVFLAMFIGMFGIAGYALFYRLRFGHYKISPARLFFKKSKVLGLIPWFALSLDRLGSEKSASDGYFGSIPWWKVFYFSDDSQRLEVHDDEDYVKKFGWLAARFRRTRWWFFAVWLTYEFIRACFYGGAAGEPMTQVFGLLVVEFIALVIIIRMRPFEGARLNALMVYLLGFSKVATVALSAAFDLRFGLERITTTVIGVVIIVIQGVLTIILMIAIVVGAISSYMSITRNREEFKPASWTTYRQKYFAHLQKAAIDRPPSPPPPHEEPKEPYFTVGSVRRFPKIEDEDGDVIEHVKDPLESRGLIEAGPATVKGTSRTNSAGSQLSPSNLPFGARAHRTSWSSRDFNGWHEAGNQNSQLMSRSSSSFGVFVKHNDGGLQEPSSAAATPTRVHTPGRLRGQVPGQGINVKKSRIGKGMAREGMLGEREDEERA